MTIVPGFCWPFVALDTPQFSMSCQWNLAELMTYLSTWSALNKYKEKNGPDLLERLTEKVAQVWGEPEDKRVLQMDIHLRAWRNELGS